MSFISSLTLDPLNSLSLWSFTAKFNVFKTQVKGKFRSCGDCTSLRKQRGRNNVLSLQRQRPTCWPGVTGFIPVAEQGAPPTRFFIHHSTSYIPHSSSIFLFPFSVSADCFAMTELCFVAEVFRPPFFGRLKSSPGSCGQDLEAFRYILYSIVVIRDSIFLIRYLFSSSYLK